MADTVARARLDYLWAAVVAENDLAFNVSKSRALQAFIDAAVVFAKPYTLPTPYKVSDSLLDKLRADAEELVRPLKECWKTTGCSLSVDGWTCMKSRRIVCVIAHNDTAPVIVDIMDSKTGDYLAGLIGNSISEVGKDLVVQKTGLLLAKDKSTFMASIKGILARRWDGQLHNPLHALGWLLNPRNQYAGEVRTDAEVRKGADQ
ncbi:unnamed protein product, partial [Closterium sp. NIES-53]